MDGAVINAGREISRTLTVRRLLQFLLAVSLLYGSSYEAASYMFYPESWDDMFHSGISLDLAILLATFCGAIILRISEWKFTIRKNPMLVAMGLMLAMFIVSYLRMVVAEGGFRIPYELKPATFYIAFATVMLLFTADDMPFLFALLLACAVEKGYEAILASLLQPAGVPFWGAHTQWRDGFVIAMYFVAWLSLFVYRKFLSPRLMRLLSILFAGVAIGFILCYRRSFIVALPLACIPMFYVMPGEERRKFAKAFALLVLFSALAIAWTDASVFTNRIAVIGSPFEEHSAAYRIFEMQNIWANIVDAPWFGYPMGQEWKIYFPLPFAVLATLNSHNTYLTVLLRGGVLGMVVFCYLAFIAYRLVNRCTRGAVRPVDKIIAMSLLGWLTMFYIASVTAPILAEQRGAQLAGIMFAFIARHYERVKDHQSQIPLT